MQNQQPPKGKNKNDNKYKNVIQNVPRQNRNTEESVRNANIIKQETVICKPNNTFILNVSDAYPKIKYKDYIWKEIKEDMLIYILLSEIQKYQILFMQTIIKAFCKDCFYFCVADAEQ